MGLIHRITSGPLTEFVDYFWLSRGYAPAHAAERILPTGQMSVLLDLRPESVAAGFVSGARASAFILDTAAPLSFLAACFRPGAGYAFVDVPAGTLQDLTVPLEAFWGGDAQRLRTQVLEAKTDWLRFQILERFLLGRLRGAAPRSAVVQFALSQFQDPSRIVSVGELVARTGIGTHRFIGEFRDQVGLAPKTFSRMVRFRQVISRLTLATEIDWTRMALECGYYDQAHFIHDFRAFAGVSPTGYMERRTPSPNHVRL